MASVSISTVSHVINGTRFVSEATRSKVKKAMKTLDYEPNVAALTLRTQKTKTIGLLIPILEDETSNIFFMQVALGVESEMKKNGYFTFLSNTNECVENEIEEIKNFNYRSVDGLIVAPPMGDHGFMKELVRNYHVVYVDRRPNGLDGNVCCVMTDSQTACFEAVSGQIALGHKKIGIICGTTDTTANVKDRLEGYKRALMAFGLPVDDSLIVQGAAKIQNGYILTKQLLENNDVTSLLITNNCHAMGAMQYVRESKIRIPAKLNITVFDDYEWTRVYNPSITVIRQHAYDLGKIAAQELIKRMNNKDAADECHMIPAQLVVRDSWSENKY